MESIFSLRGERPCQNVAAASGTERKPLVCSDPDGRRGQKHKTMGLGKFTHSSDDSRIPCSTDLSARPAVAATHMMNPKRWKLGSPCIVYLGWECQAFQIFQFQSLAAKGSGSARIARRGATEY